MKLRFVASLGLPAILWWFPLLLPVANSFSPRPSPSLLNYHGRPHCHHCQGISVSSSLRSNQNVDDMMLQELSDLLQDLLATNDTQETLLNRRLDLRLNRCCLGPSQVGPNGGRGLFAAKPCKKGALLTCYPGDVLVCFQGSANFCDMEQQKALEDDDETVYWGDHVGKSFRLNYETISSTLSSYQLEVSNHHVIVALPTHDDNMAYAGHFANDGASIVPSSSIESQISSYVLESNELANAMHISLQDGCHMVTVATKDIPVGGEILVTYGPDYWMEHATREASTGTDEGIRNGNVLSNQKDSTSNGKGFG